MNASVRDELLKALRGNRLPDSVEAGDADDAGRIVHHDVGASRLFNRSDVPAFTTDNPSLEVIRRDLHPANRGIADVLCRVTLNGEKCDFPALIASPIFGRADDFLLDLGGFMLRIVPYLLEKMGSCIIAAHFSGFSQAVL